MASNHFPSPSMKPHEVISGAIMPPFADSTYPCLGLWSMQSEECAHCARCADCMASLFATGEFLERAKALLENEAEPNIEVKLEAIPQ